MGRALASTLALGLLLGACGSHAPPVSEACAGRGQGTEVRTALRAAPARVVLADGTRLSECIERAMSDTDLQNIGGQFTRAGADLAARASRDPESALRLGFLVGAVERGSGRTAGFQAELENRMRSYTTDTAIRGAERRALARGRRAGRAGG
jgi:hypothetical protein